MCWRLRGQVGFPACEPGSLLAACMHPAPVLLRRQRRSWRAMLSPRACMPQQCARTRLAGVPITASALALAAVVTLQQADSGQGLHTTGVATPAAAFHNTTFWEQLVGRWAVVVGTGKGVAGTHKPAPLIKCPCPEPAMMLTAPTLQSAVCSLAMQGGLDSHNKDD